MVTHNPDMKDNKAPSSPSSPTVRPRSRTELQDFSRQQHSADVQWRRSLHMSEGSPAAKQSSRVRDQLSEDVLITRNMVQHLGHSEHKAVLRHQGSFKLDALLHPAKRGREAAQDHTHCLENNGFRVDVLIAAAAVYKMLYAPKGSTQEMDSQAWVKYRKSCLSWGFLLAVSGIVISAYQNEVLWANNRNPNGTTLVLKIVQLLTSCGAIYFLRGYYSAVIALERLRGLPMHNGDVSFLNLQACGIYTQALIDLLIMLPQPIPFLNAEFEVYNAALEGSCVYQLDSLLVVCMFLRIRLIPRFYGECISDIGNDVSRAFGNIARVTIGDSFIFKYLITTSIGMVLLLWVTQVVFFAYCLMIFERPMSFNTLAHSKLHEFANCVWCAVITMTIVGYGDVYPLTFLGRWAMITASISALIMVAITTNIVHVFLTQSRAEQKCVEVMSCLDSRDAVKIKAAELIQASWRAFSRPTPRARRRDGVRPGTKVAHDQEVMKAVWDFIGAERGYTATVRNMSSDEQSGVASSSACAVRCVMQLQMARCQLGDALATLRALKPSALPPAGVTRAQ
ncbi:hypothetical protein T484DRAFT_1965993 [Baffinella frigidus]|nr:hypothetical protein T484DRAFT_1965993 [Cryptophyta sp. CCMP2293]|mmetsp:Transcript_60310/g.143332  ORF Transcript_60310/g.143332 Transcript_60310/m.143332 type:complete len:566 (+) Transcript_60310:27-1724(+)